MGKLYTGTKIGGKYMLLIKLIGCVLVIISTTGMGLFFSGELKSRLEDLKELKKIIILLRGDIRYARTPLPEAIGSIGRRHEGSYKTFLENVSLSLHELSGQTFAQVWKRAVEEDLQETSLVKKDKLDLIQFGENIGYLDKDMQMNTLDLYITQLEAEIIELTGNLKEKTYLYNTLGLMAGIFISIVLF